MGAAEQYLVQPDFLTEVVTEIFIKAGVEGRDAAVVAESMVEANLRGTDSHGVLRVENYVKRIQQGGTKARTEFAIINETPTTVAADAQHGLGAVAADRLGALVREKALQHNLGFGVVRRSNHYGAAALWALKAAGDDMIGFSCSNVEPIMSAIGGKTAAIGNNPFALAIPAGRHHAICLDMATSVAAWGKVVEYRHLQKPLPEGWAVDADGEKTTDPFKASLLEAFGGHKGFGLAVGVEVLSSLLAGGAFLDMVGTMYKDITKPNDLSHCCAAIRISAFRDPAAFRADVDDLIDRIKRGARKEGTAEIFYPGEIEARKKAVNLEKGLKLPASVAEELAGFAREHGLDARLTAGLTATPAN
ncbi:MAG: Ldh family oxidoreductase [Candidatus Adiutrix sp.]|jgi:ureidoglycolate dehydrogenase (NAD+)|nr:Ldh family oxidoreductase [Candidatus Adiutrix sp.]